MSRMNELATELAELKRCGEILIGISESLTEIFSATEAERAAEETSSFKEETTPAPVPEREPKQPTLVEVRKVMTEKSRSGHTKEVKALLAKYGSDNLSGLNPTYYAAILAEAEEIGNG